MSERDLDNTPDVSRLLAELPREHASVGFRTRVLARVGEIERQPRFGPALRWGLAATALVAAVVGGASWRAARDAGHTEVAARAAEVAAGAPQVAPPVGSAVRTRQARRLEQMRSEYSDLERELRQLRRLMAASEPIVGVEGSGEYDYVLDLQQLARARGGDAFPVSYRLPE